jgi:hypothetical protein
VSNEVASTDGLLVLRLWTEPGAGVRVRITRNTDHGPGTVTSYAASKAEVLTAVGRWMDDLVADPEPRSETS